MPNTTYLCFGNKLKDTDGTTKTHACVEPKCPLFSKTAIHTGITNGRGEIN